MICIYLALWSLNLEVRPHVELVGSSIYLRDLVTVDSQKDLRTKGLSLVLIGPAPPRGQVRTLNRSFIEGLLSREDVQLRFSGAQACRVSKKSQILPQELLQAEIVNWLASHGGFSLERMKASLPKHLAPGKLRFDIFALSKSLKPGRNLLMVDTYVDGVKKQGTPVTVLLTLQVRAARLMRTVNRGESIHESDLAWETVKLDRQSATLIQEGQVHDIRARMMIPAGTLLDFRKVEKTPMVQRNQLVYVFATHGTLQVRMQAKSMDRGGMGDTVRLKNIESGRLFMATVSGLGEAQLHL